VSNLHLLNIELSAVWWANLQIFEFKYFVKNTQKLKVMLRNKLRILDTYKYINTLKLSSNN